MAPIRTLGALTSTALLAGSLLALAPAPEAVSVATVAEAAGGRALAQAEPDGAPDGGVWTEAYIDTADGERLHADVFRSAGKDDTVEEPVILVVSPYLGQESMTAKPAPAARFFDFFEGADVLGQGYTVVQVSTRGTGGSSGCLDILGPGEQEDIRASVAWAASQPWSTGKVGMYGKSYDANTGSAGAATLTADDGLYAVVAQQIAVDRYRGSYNDRVRLLQSLAYPGVSYGSGGEAGFSTQSEAEFVLNSVSRSADCQALLAPHYVDDEELEFWRVRDLVDLADDSTVPTFITTGYLDTATNVGAGAIDLFETLEGPKRLWVGWWDHVRGNDTVGDQLAMGREGFFDEVMAWYDEHLKGVAPTVDYPTIAAQGSDGVWRAEETWRAADAADFALDLLPGTYADDGTNIGSRDTGAGAGGVAGTGRPFVTGNGTWTFTDVLTHEVHVAGTPTATVDIGAPAVPRANIAVNVYDVGPDGRATMITRGAGTLDGAGTEEVLLFPTDWTFAPGHRIAVLVSGANQEAYIHTPTGTTVSVLGGTVSLPYLTVARTEPLPGTPAPRLGTYRLAAPFDVTADIPSRTNSSSGTPDPQTHPTAP